MTRMVAVSALALALFLCADTRGQQAAKIEVKVIKYEGLKKLLREQRGKVVVVWLGTTWNIPAVKSQLQVLELHRKLQTNGLVTICVNLDQTGETGGDETAKQRDERVLSRLRKLDSTVLNLILDENHELIAEKFGAYGPPFVYIFNRQGKWHRVSYRDEELPGWSRMENLIVELLQEKQ